MDNRYNIRQRAKILKKHWIISDNFVANIIDNIIKNAFEISIDAYYHETVTCPCYGLLLLS